MAWAGWLSGVGRLDCPTCQATWADFDGVPPCETCRPGMAAGNEEPIRVYSLCAGPIAVDPFQVMRLEGVGDERGCLQDVQAIAAEIARLHRAEAEKRRNK